MAETTRDAFIEAQRYRGNKEQDLTAKDDEDVIESIADYVMVSTEGVQNPNLKAALRDIANQLIQNKTILAKGGGEEQMAEPAMPPMPPPGAMPPQGMNPMMAPPVV